MPIDKCFTAVFDNRIAHRESNSFFGVVSVFLSTSVVSKLRLRILKDFASEESQVLAVLVKVISRVVFLYGEAL